MHPRGIAWSRFGKPMRVRRPARRDGGEPEFTAPARHVRRGDEGTSDPGSSAAAQYAHESRLSWRGGRFQLGSHGHGAIRAKPLRSGVAPARWAVAAPVEGDDMRRLLVSTGSVASILLLLLLGALRGAAAQEATVTAGEAVPPEECLVEPYDLLPILQDVVATPVAAEATEAAGIGQPEATRPTG